MSLGDRWDTQETPESDDEREFARHARHEREIDRADYLLDELRDRQAEEVDMARNGKESA